MTDSSDPELLRAYARHRSESAFAEIVRRYVDLVHSAALRMVRDPDLAKDISQAVFVALAKDAGRLADHPVLSGWLHRTARNIAAQSIRTDSRRRGREHEAAAMNDSPEADAPWEEIAPHLDAALGELGESDRDAVLLRYFENKPAHEMAATLGISAEAAQKRVSRAVEKLRENFARRGITAGAVGLAGVLSTNSVQAAPVELSKRISAASSQAISTIVLRKFLVTAAVAISVVLAVHQSARVSKLRQENVSLRQSFNARPTSTARAQSVSDSATARVVSPGASGGFQVMASVGGPTDPGEFSLIAPGGRGITTGAAEAADLTPEERKTVDGILRATWQKVADDFARRAVAVKAESDSGAGRSVFTIPARPDRGKAYATELEHALDGAVGAQERRILMQRLNPDQALGGFGSFNVRMEFNTKGGFAYQCLYFDPESGEKSSDLSGGRDSFIDLFGDSFEVPTITENSPQFHH